ncbi:hypothetical protein CSUI_002310 [Cystoisospora suis]|uniref:Transmembrane protein n=1 Tax=Cystoisospora suis TaxID=483139 RepID=A0A2C6KUD7_9APIC|nr:hypothetical protein CSUI_002310 [Cystoisospora suis]
MTVCRKSASLMVCLRIIFFSSFMSFFDFLFFFLLVLFILLSQVL